MANLLLLESRFQAFFNRSNLPISLISPAEYLFLPIKKLML